MYLVLFNRPTAKFKVFDEAGAEKLLCAAGGDAWGDGTHAPYGHDYPIPPGWYKLTQIEEIKPPSNSEGAFQIYVADLDQESINEFVEHKLAQQMHDVVTINEISLPIGELARYDRSEVMIHGGGSNAPEPLADEQELCKTYGCTRLHNADLAKLVEILEPEFASGQHVIYGVIGDPISLPC